MYKRQDSVVGVTFDTAEAQRLIDEAGGKGTVTVPLTITQPKISKEHLTEVLFRDTLTQQKTSLNPGNVPRTANVRLAARASIPQAAELLLELGIPPESLSQPVSTFSGGMKRRVALCRALLAEYDVLTLDEPYKGLDGDTRARVMRLVDVHTRGRTVILVTHAAEEAAGHEMIHLPV